MTLNMSPDISQGHILTPGENHGTETTAEAMALCTDKGSTPRAVTLGHTCCPVLGA